MNHSRADQHDIDKLGRWLPDLPGDAAGAFPVYTICLVAPSDRTAHDIFRRYRASFEARGVGFANLVIFGQHGVSSTVRYLLDRWGLSEDRLPLLVLLPGDQASSGYALALPQGEADPLDSGDSAADAPRWQRALAAVEAAVTTPERGVNLEGDSVDSFVFTVKMGTSLERLVREAWQSLQQGGS
jgi:hypothetical protein